MHIPLKYENLHPLLILSNKQSPVTGWRGGGPLPLKYMAAVIKLNAATWTLDNVDMCTRNLMRHALMADVPVQAVDRVTFHAYDGPLECAMVAHRFGQLPIRGTQSATFDVQLEAAADAPLTWVTTAHIVGDEAGQVVKGTEGGKATCDEFQLVPLLAGQRLHVTCQTSLGTGRRRTTWASVFPVFKHVNENTCILKVETTGAVTPEGACIAALQSCCTVYASLLAAL